MSLELWLSPGSPRFGKPSRDALRAACSWVSERIIVEVVRDEIPRHSWGPVTAIAVLVVVTATVGVVIAISKTSLTHVPRRPTPIPTSIPMPTPTALQPPPDLSGTWLGVCSSGSHNYFCTLTLTKTADGFDGTFTLEAPSVEPLHVKGNLIGSTITLRSASDAVFTGTLTGSTLSGAYISSGKTYSWSVTLEA